MHTQTFSTSFALSIPMPNMDYTSSLYYDTLDLSDISEFEDLMTTSSDEDIPALDKDIGY